MEACGGGIPDFSFGFNNVNYSDRILLLQIAEDADESSRQVRNVKHRSTYTAITLSPPPRVKALHISSLILAARSPFFRKLFSNGMRESEQKHVTLQIEAIEEGSFMDLLSYVYSNNLPTTMYALLNLLAIADKFEVASCLSDCTRSLQNLPMTCESASVYLDLPTNLLMSPTVQPLIDAAKQFLVVRFKYLHEIRFGTKVQLNLTDHVTEGPKLHKKILTGPKWSEEEVLKLPLLGFQAVLSSDDLQVGSEYEVFDAVLEWAREHYPNLGERREILKTHLLHLVRFPFMTTTELAEEVQTYSDIDPELASDIVIRALRFKAETPQQKRCIAAEETSAASRQFVERAYISRPVKVKVVELESPIQQCVVYLDFTRHELKGIFPDDEIWSEAFYLGELELCLIGRCSLDKRSNVPYFWLALDAWGSSTFTLNFDVALRRKSHVEFRFLCEGRSTFTEPRSITYLHGVPWTGFIGDDSTYFINDVLHVRVEITIEN